LEGNDIIIKKPNSQTSLYVDKPRERKTKEKRALISKKKKK